MRAALHCREQSPISIRCGGLAVLFGKQRFQADVNGVFASGGVNSSGPTASAFTFSGNACTSSIDTGVGTIHPLLGCDTNKAVFNADASVALSYTFTPRAKLSAGMRFDGYWAALRTLNTHFTGDSIGLHNEDRFFWGPFLRLTGQF